MTGKVDGVNLCDKALHGFSPPRCPLKKKKGAPRTFMTLSFNRATDLWSSGSRRKLTVTREVGMGRAPDSLLN